MRGRAGNGIWAAQHVSREASASANSASDGGVYRHPSARITYGATPPGDPSLRVTPLWAE